MSILDRLGKIKDLYNYTSASEYDFFFEPEINPLKKELQKKRMNYKQLKYICNKCGAFINKEQGFCGICKGANFRRASKEEIEQTLTHLEDYHIEIL